jgi:hypothetical protein
MKRSRHSRSTGPLEGADGVAGADGAGADATTETVVEGTASTVVRVAFSRYFLGKIGRAHV